jgi:hypothetical protein
VLDCAHSSGGCNAACSGFLKAAWSCVCLPLLPAACPKVSTWVRAGQFTQQMAEGSRQCQSQPTAAGHSRHPWAQAFLCHRGIRHAQATGNDSLVHFGMIKCSLPCPSMLLQSCETSAAAARTHSATSTLGSPVRQLCRYPLKLGRSVISSRRYGHSCMLPATCPASLAKSKEQLVPILCSQTLYCTSNDVMQGVVCDEANCWRRCAFAG